MNEIVKVIWGPDPETDFDVGLVVGCDPDIGITIVNADDTDMYLCCCIGPLAPQSKMLSDAEKARYLKAFPIILRQIDVGAVDKTQLEKEMRQHLTGTQPSQEHCPFGQ